MLVEYNKYFLGILSRGNQENSAPSAMVGGADEIFRICEAFFLLQTNTQFIGATNALLEQCQKSDYASLIAIINPYRAGEASLKSVLKI